MITTLLGLTGVFLLLAAAAFGNFLLGLAGALTCMVCAWLRGREDSQRPRTP